MFERFRRSRGTDAGEGPLATRERDTTTEGTDRDLDPASDRVDSARFERVSPGERDRGVVAGGGESDLAADRSFEHDDVARGAAAAGAGAAAGAAIEHHHDRKVARDEMTREQVARDEAARDDAVARDRGMGGGGVAVGRGPARDLDRDGVDDRVERHGPVLAP